MTEIPTLTNRGRYAVKAMIEIARSDSPIPLHAVSKNIDLSLSYLEQIIATLRNRNLVTSITGRHGGYTLAKPPSKITIAQIVNATEDRTYGAPKPKETFDPSDPSELLWRHIVKTTLDQLQTITLADALSLKL